MREWIDNKFGITTNVDGDEVFYFENDGREIEVSLVMFLHLFGSVGTPPTYEGLVTLDPENRTGWHRHFDCWKEKGILN